MGRKKNSVLWEYKADPLFTEFMEDMEEREDARDVLLNAPTSARSELAKFLLMDDPLLGEPVVVSDEVPESVVSHSNPTEIINDEEFTKSEVINFLSAGLIKIEEEAIDLTAALLNEQVAVSMPVDDPNIRRILPSGISSRLDLIGVESENSIVSLPDFVVDSASPRPPTVRASSRQATHIKKSSVPVSLPEQNDNQSLAELANFLVNLPVSGSRKGEYKSHEMQVRLSPNVTRVLRSLSNYLTDSRSTGRVKEAHFRPDDLADYLFRQFLREHIEGLRELKQHQSSPA